MVKTHESLKKSISTVLQQLSLRTSSYPHSEQKRLDELLDLIRHYEEADFNRKKLVLRFAKYNKGTLQDEEYLGLPFLWFSGIYSQNAKVLLEHSKFHAISFYEFLAKHLRGAFRLVNNLEPLSSILWEDLQYEANKLLQYLTKRDLETLRVEFRLLKEKGVVALSARRQREFIMDYIEFFRDETPSAELKRLFSILNGKWVLHFFPPAFDLNRVFFELQIVDAISLNEIIDFTNFKNTTLAMSDIYNTREDPKRYLGFLIVPTNCVTVLKANLVKFRDKGKIKLEKFSSVLDYRKNISLRQYHSEKGWLNTSSTYLRKLKRIILSSGSAELEYSTNSTGDDYYIPNAMDTNWNYRDHPLPHRIIELVCRMTKEFTFSDLPIGSDDLRNPSSLAIDELGLLKQLYYNRVVYPVFIPWQIVYEFSLNNFCVYIPKISFSNLKKIVEIIPYSEVIFTKEFNFLFGRLTPRLVNWIRSDLGWDVHMVSRTHKKPMEFNSDWFDKRSLTWVVPEVLSQ
ncbi:MAG: hypothetical protein ACFFE8_15620 [Candidatus Heimdallarchaeota archaeon]